MAKIKITGVSKAKEAEVVPEGRYTLRVHSVTEEESSKGNPMLVILHVIEGSDYDDPAPVMHYLTLPPEDLDEDDEDAVKRANFLNLQIARYCAMIGVEIDDDEELDTEDMEGKTFECDLIQEPFNEDSDEMVNRIKVPRLGSGDDEDDDDDRPARGKKGKAKPSRKGKKDDDEEDEADEEEAEEETEDADEADDADEAEESDEDEEDEDEAPKRKAPVRASKKPAPKGRRR